MARGQNFATNRKIIEEVKKNQKDYVIPVDFSYGVIASETDYNKLLNDASSGLSKYYAAYPREDGIDKDGKPVTDPNTEVVGHSWESAINQPTDPAKTSTFPWIVLSFNDFVGNIEVKYDGEVKYTRTWTSPRQFAILSVPNSLKMTDYRLEWGTGETGDEVFNPELLEITATASKK